MTGVQCYYFSYGNRWSHESVFPSLALFLSVFIPFLCFVSVSVSFFSLWLFLCLLCSFIPWFFIRIFSSFFSLAFLSQSLYSPLSFFLSLPLLSTSGSFADRLLALAFICHLFFFLSLVLSLSASSFLPWLSFCRQSPLIKNDPAIFFLTKMYIDPASQATDTLEDFWQLCSRLPQYACSQFLTDKDDSKLSSLHSAQYTPPLTTPTPPISPPPPLSVTPDHMRPLSPLSGRNSRVSNHELSLLDWLPPPAPCRSPTVPRRRSQPQQSSLLLPRSLTLTPRLPRNYMPSLPSTEDLTFYRC